MSVPTPQSHPFNDTHYQVISNTLQAVQTAKQLIAKGTAVGLDVSQLQAINDQHENTLVKLKQQFFPHMV